MTRFPHARLLCAPLCLCGALLFSPSAHAQPTIAGKPYSKLTTRQDTREAFLKQLSGVSATLGPWMLLTPLDHPEGGKNIDHPYPPEDLLPRMKPGTPALDLSTLTYTAKNGQPIRFRAIEEKPDIGGMGGPAPLDLADGVAKADQRSAVAYLYRTIESARDADLPITTGSDDGLRLWLNGELLLDANAERPLDPQQHRLTLKLKPGTNHLFAKISQGAGEWQFQLLPELNLDPLVEAQLDYQLDEDFPDAESRYYRIVTIPKPVGTSLEVGGLDVLPAPDGRPVVCTRRGDVFIIENAYAAPPAPAKFTTFASGLQEPLGLQLRAETDESGKPRTAVYVAQRTELTKMWDTSGFARADVFKTLSADWKVSTNYHEYAFGPALDAAGNAWITLNLAHTNTETVMGATVPDRGCVVKVSPDGSMTRICDGLRSPDGIGLGPGGDVFYTDNQGDYVATNKLCHVKPGAFYGHQSTLRFREGYGDHWKQDGKPVPPITWPAVWFPYKKMGQSTTGFVVDATAGKFGPFAGQLFVGEQTYCWVTRVFLEKVEGEWQGACFPFRQGFASGVHRLAFGTDGSLLVGMTDRGWGSTGPKRDGLQRLVWTGRIPLEIEEMRITPVGFDLRFTLPVGPEAEDAARYRMISYTYEYHPDYGSPEIDREELTVASARRLDPRTISLKVNALRSGGCGHVHELTIDGLMSRPADPKTPPQPLLHTTAYYTVQRVPKAP